MWANFPTPEEAATCSRGKECFESDDDFEALIASPLGVLVQEAIIHLVKTTYNRHTQLAQVSAYQALAFTLDVHPDMNKEDFVTLFNDKRLVRRLKRLDRWKVEHVDMARKRHGFMSYLLPEHQYYEFQPLPLY